MAQEVNLNSLQEVEREEILQVLYRDQAVQNIEEERIRKLKTHLQRLRWKGAKSVSQEYKQKSCARCQRMLGFLLNRGAVCHGCSHRVCSECRVFLRRTHAWKCTVCFEDRNMKIKTGEWFFEERAKKFPTEGKHETAGAKLLQSYQKLSKISVVPPTPPPLSESWCSGSPGKLQELGQFKGFNKSMENLFLSVTTHMKKLSKSQNDMTSDKQLLATGPRQCTGQSERRSQSDTAINVTTRKVSAPDILIPLDQESPRRFTSPVLKQEDLLFSPTPDTLFSGGLRHGSLISINSTCTEMGNFDKANVTGEIEFAIRYCFKTHSLEICIKACKNLAYGEEKKKKCNPYVKTYLLPDRSSQGKRKTGVQRNTVDPTFQETVKYQVESAQLVTRRLQVSVWHLGMLARRVFLGEVIIPLATWDFEDSATQSFRWYQLRAKTEKYEDVVPPNNGELAVRAKLVLPAGPTQLQRPHEGTGDHPSPNGQLCLVVLGAKNLPVRSDGTLNSFVKGCLTLPEQQKLTLKSPVLKKQACPQWKHSFVFKDVSPSQLRQASLELTVWDQAIFGVNDRLLGGARLGAKEDPAGGADACSQSKLQWQKVLSSPNLWTDMTLILH
ncbi:synaptotagmin-like protein 3 isoform X1 [Equus przewalskii]|nr:synaptotagmin-like protein 3 isoform X1 [Equus caballus]XP_005608165.1 synaptotagmin-like protein 3 isoform X1 [Equus caballus]XP_005608166.1 synaptotagmin-like protein 3 isoform X1 [Equus caballus]XP_005608170.1 synaptotagmin-like protein 3 isoform X1 [Equus caballus]XP_008523153.1 PREDICTED: synaptotagmin-like protein 3 [Equus przewalskii]XP_008523154.1 PREDICTED: synaptotagmin-like protein 3 [Equus przewalskii]XP_008523155.1 PREDICTED: synaptotagmin-like protein 3 [Equus przewalskii]XP